LLVTDESTSPPIAPAVVTILRAREDAPSDISRPLEPYHRPISFSASVVAIQDSLMLLRVPKQTPVSSALKIETADALWLGETEKCDREGDSWLIRVRLHHVLRDFDTLARLAERFGTAAPRKVSVQA
jgi:hypothetical protein